MRYGTETRRDPDEVLEAARRFFGPDSELGLPEVPGEAGSLTFATETGGVSVTATRSGPMTEVTVLSREYDSWAERFIRSLY
jgi:hypothetical protein